MSEPQGRSEMYGPAVQHQSVLQCQLALACARCDDPALLGWRVVDGIARSKLELAFWKVAG